jgi:hypothetical protein
MKSFAYGRAPGQFVLNEGTASREVVTLAAGSGWLPPGTVLGQIASSGAYTVSAATGSDGSELPGAILYDFTDIRSGDVEAVVIIRNAEVNGEVLVFDASVDTDAKKRAKCSALLDVPNCAQPIVVRAPWMDAS